MRLGPGRGGGPGHRASTDYVARISHTYKAGNHGGQDEDLHEPSRWGLLICGAPAPAATRSILSTTGMDTGRPTVHPCSGSNHPLGVK